MTKTSFKKSAETYVNALHSIRSDALDEFFQHISDGVEFKDPFNHVHGKGQMREVFRDMYEKLQNVSFEVHEFMTDAPSGRMFLLWTFRAENKWTGDMAFKGMSDVTLDAAGKVSRHIDHWDAASEIYEKIPVAGSVVRALKRKLSTPA